MMITVEDFDKVEMRVGTVIEAEINKKARTPAYKLKINFGGELGVKTSSAQITALYTPEELVGKQVVCCVNLEPMRLGSESAQGVVLLRLTEKVADGDRIF